MFTCLNNLRICHLIFIVALMCANACSQKHDPNKILEQLDNGKVVGNTYDNKLLGLRISFPDKMAVDEKSAVATDLQEFIDALRKGKNVDQKALDEMIRKDRIVFTLDLPESNQSIGSTMSLTLKKDETTEELTAMVNRTLKFFTESAKQKVIAPARSERLGKLDFIAASTSMDVEGGTVYSKIYCLRRNGYLATFSISYSDSGAFKEMEKVISDIELY